MLELETATHLRKHRSKLAAGVAESGYVRLGGVDQWVMIRGDSVTNPPVILVHGGPGFPETPLFRHFNASLEKSFTVVYWEQRGAGKSFTSNLRASSMTIERFISDLDELVDSVRKRLGRDKVVILGHSWGSAIGTLYAARFPEKVAAYVGAGQIGDFQASERLSYDFVLAEAERRKNQKALRALRASGGPPYTSRALAVQRKWLTRFVGLARGIPFWKILRIFVRGPGGSLTDLPNILRGALFSSSALWAELADVNLVKTVPSLQMPVFFLVGRHDHQVAAETTVAYFNVLTAPSKELIWFEESAHSVAFEEPVKFNAVMTEQVAPIARHRASVRGN